jgi:hypothetical protein
MTITQAQAQSWGGLFDDHRHRQQQLFANHVADMEFLENYIHGEGHDDPRNLMRALAIINNANCPEHAPAALQYFLTELKGGVLAVDDEYARRNTIRRTGLSITIASIALILNAVADGTVSYPLGGLFLATAALSLYFRPDVQDLHIIHRNLCELGHAVMAKIAELSRLNQEQAGSTSVRAQPNM